MGFRRLLGKGMPRETRMFPWHGSRNGADPIVPRGAGGFTNPCPLRPGLLVRSNRCVARPRRHSGGLEPPEHQNPHATCPRCFLLGDTQLGKNVDGAGAFCPTLCFSDIHHPHVALTVPHAAPVNPIEPSWAALRAARDHFISRASISLSLTAIRPCRT